MTSPSCTAHVAGRERAAVAVAVDLQDDGPVDLAGSEEVPVQRVGQALCRHRQPGGAQGLRGDLAAVQRLSTRRSDPALRLAVVAVEHLEVEERRDVDHLSSRERAR